MTTRTGEHLAECIRRGPLTAFITERWHDAADFRRYAYSPEWTHRPVVHAIAVETIEVEVGHRGRGLCRDFIRELCEDERFEMVVVEGVQSDVLRAALERWGWSCDRGVGDYYWRRGVEGKVPSGNGAN